jgi:Domain of unknown function (DUF4175)
MDVTVFLSEMRRRLRRVVLAQGAATIVVLGVGGIALGVTLDYLWTAPAVIRFMLLVGLFVALTSVVYRRLIRPLGQKMDDRTLAHIAERRIPELDGRLLTQVEGIQLDAANVQSLKEQLQAGTVRVLVPAHTLPKKLWAAVGALGISLVAVVLFPSVVSDGMKRFLLPFGATEWERHSHLSGQIERAVVAEDEPVVVRIKREAGPAAALYVNWRPLNKGSAAETRLLSGMQGPWSQAFNLQTGSYEFTAESGDALPLRLTAQVVRRPQLAEMSAILTPPAYTKLPPITLPSLTCTALPGSTLSYRIGLQFAEGRTLQDAQLQFNDAPMTFERAEHQVVGTLPISAGGVISLHVDDQDRIALQPAPQFTVALSEDRKPIIALAGPHNKELVTSRARIGLALDASDDYGLAQLSLSMATFVPPKESGNPAEAKTEDKPSKQTTLPFTDIKGQKATTRRSEIVIAELATEGDRIVLQGQALDANNVTGPGRGESQPLELRVVSESELRQEIDRLLTEARDRVVQAREEIAQGLSKPERLIVSLRASTMSNNRANDTLSQVVRRWRENQLPADQGAPIKQAASLVSGEVASQLADAVAEKTTEKDLAARQADKHLAETEKLLNSLLQEGDLTRILASLIDRQRSLGEESRSFVREHLTKALDEAAKARQANLSQRQKELADQVKEVERRILSSSAPQLEEARKLVRSATPADQLQQAASELGSGKERAQAIPRQETSLKTLETLLQQLRGNDAVAELAQKAGELAARQEALVRQMENGTEPKSLEKEQQKLKEDTEQLAKQLQKQPEQQKKADAATQAQSAAQKAMQKNDNSGSQREGSAAADLLRAIQQELQPKPEQQKEDEKKKNNPDVVKILKELHGLQVALIADSTVIHLRIGEGELDFAASREIPALAEREADILLRLREEAMKEVSQMPIALLALQRVEKALQAASDYLKTPALGNRGMRLEKIALYEMSRLLDIIENMPKPEQTEKGGNGGGGGGQTPPFPPSAFVALLLAAQEETQALTAANRPINLAQAQTELSQLTGVMLEQTRPNSRSALLLSRTQRAMLSAAERLSQSDRGAVTRMEQDAAIAAMRRLFSEAKASENQSGGNGSADNTGENEKQRQQQNQQQKNNGQSDGNDGGQKQSDGQPGTPTSASQQSNKQGNGTQTGVVTGAQERGEFMHLPPERREQLRQAYQQNLPPAALSIFERYLEVLENEK